MLGANIFRIGERLDNRVNYTCQFIEYKQAIARATKGPKIVVIGASNVLYGIRSAKLSSRTGLPVVNFGLTASLDIGTIMAAARDTLKPGDTALLNVENFFFIEYPLDGPFFKQAMFQCPAQRYADLGPVELAKAVLAQSPLDVVQGTIQHAARLLNLPLPFKVSVYPFEINKDFSREGDLLSNGIAHRTPEMVDRVSRGPGGITLDFSESSTGIRAVRSFVSWARKNDVAVIVSWPNVYWPEKAKAEPGLRKVRQFYESLGLPIVGEPTDGMHPLEDFFNTNNHLTAEAAARRSDEIGSLVAAYLKTRMSSGAAAGALLETR